MKKRFLSILLSILLAFCFVTNTYADNFIDTNKHWAQAYIDWCQEKGYVNGYTDNSFKPNNFIIRSEFSKIISNYLGLNDDYESRFIDVNKDDWFYKQVTNLDYLSAYDIQGDLFEPNKKVTREEAFYIIARALGIKGDANLIESYNDYKDVNYKVEVAGLISYGIINGCDGNTLKPGAFITRAEICKIIYCLELNKYKYISDKQEEKNIEKADNKTNDKETTKDNLNKDKRYKKPINDGINHDYEKPIITRKYKISFEFISASSNKSLPEEILIRTPNAVNVNEGEFYNPPVVENNYQTSEGKWIFKGWAPEKIYGVYANTNFVGIWEFKKAEASKHKIEINLPKGRESEIKVEVISGDEDGDLMVEEGKKVKLKFDFPSEKEYEVYFNGKPISLDHDNTFSFTMTNNGATFDIKDITPHSEGYKLITDKEKIEESKNSYIKINTEISKDNKALKGKSINYKFYNLLTNEILHLDSEVSNSAGENDYYFALPDFTEPGQYILAIKAEMPENNYKEISVTIKDENLKIKSLEKLNDIEVFEGDELVLPNYVTATYINDFKRRVKIEWDIPDNINEIGEHELIGKVEDYDEKVKLKVIVKEKPVVITSIESIDTINLELGEELKLPKKAVVNLSNGQREERDITWEENNIDTNKIGEYKVFGKVEGYDKKIELKVIVSEKLDLIISMYIAEGPGKDSIVYDQKEVEEVITTKKKGDYTADYRIIVNGIDVDLIEETSVVSGKDSIFTITRRPDYEEAGFTNANVRIFGNVKSVGKADAIITVKLKDGRKVEKKIPFTFGAQKSNPLFAINPDDKEFNIGEEVSLPKTVQVMNADGKKNWTSVNWNTNNIDFNEEKTYRIEGTVGGLDEKVFINVNMKKGKNVVLKFNYESFTVYKDEIIPENGEIEFNIDGITLDDIKDYEIKTDNPNIVIITSQTKNGLKISAKAKAVGVGQANIIGYVRTIDNKTSEIKIPVTVNKAKEPEVKFDEYTYTLNCEDMSDIMGSPYSVLRLTTDPALPNAYYFKVTLPDNTTSFSPAKINSTETADVMTTKKDLIGKELTISIYESASSKEVLYSFKYVLKDEIIDPGASDYTYTVEAEYDGYMGYLVFVKSNRTDSLYFNIFKDDSAILYDQEPMINSEDSAGYVSGDLDLNCEYTIVLYSDKGRTVEVDRFKAKIVERN